MAAGALTACAVSGRTLQTDLHEPSVKFTRVTDTPVFLPPATVVAERLCFTGICQFTGGGGVHPPRQPPFRQTPSPRLDTPRLGRHPPGRHLPLGQTPPPETATAADVKHPIGMHFCLKKS